jgi:sugar transferase (PEP-CTERM/EpsH1 system associated)
VKIDRRPLIAHVLYRFDTGGLENGVANLINRLSPTAYRHAVIALTEVTEFRRRVVPTDVTFVSMNKQPGSGTRLLPAMWRLLRQLRPALVHTRNLAALEMQPAAWAAGVSGRIHSEHGRDIDDPDGSHPGYRRVRRMYSPFVSRYVALSGELERYLTESVGISALRVQRICNGVDASRFRPREAERPTIAGCPFDGRAQWWVGTVGRMQEVKDQTLLARAFCRALELQPSLRDFARLLMVGEGPLRLQALEIIRQANAESLAWLPGERTDVPEVMRALDAFVLPSRAEGISNTVLEAMATGLPVIATNVGGNAELVKDGASGVLVPAQNVESLARAIVRLASNTHEGTAMGRVGRLEVEQRFSLEVMVAAYQELYERALWRRDAGRG